MGFSLFKGMNCAVGGVGVVGNVVDGEVDDVGAEAVDEKDRDDIVVAIF
jgi:hypothetical protein